MKEIYVEVIMGSRERDALIMSHLQELALARGLHADGGHAFSQHSEGGVQCQLVTSVLLGALLIPLELLGETRLQSADLIL